MRKTTTGNRKKKSPIKKLDEQCLKLWSQCVITRDRTCRNCNSDERLSAHHIRSRTHKNTKYDIRNGLTLCWKCHSQQKFNPERFQDFVLDIIGQQKYNHLKLLSAVVTDITIADLEDTKEVLTAKLKDLKNG